MGEIEALAAAGESETLEFKRSKGQRGEGTKGLCAMLNHRGGRVLFGIEPNGKVDGQDVGDRTIEDISQEIGEIDPPVFPSIDRIPLASGREVLVVSNAAGQNQPYSYKGKAYRRVGNTNLVMSRDEYNRMLLERLHGERRWENEPATGWSVADLDAAEMIRTIEEAIRRGRIEDPGTREPEEVLRGFGLMKQGVILRAAVVLFGRSERLTAEFPQCLLRAARFAGTDKTEFLDNRQFRGNAFELLAAAERFILDHLPIAGRVQPGQLERVDMPMYPPLALREALANAFCHRDYAIGGGSVGIAIFDDRLEVTSSGTLHFGLTPAALFGPHESLPWNPLVAGVFYRRGIIESWGRGTIRMAELAEAAGMPHPEIEDIGGGVSVRFRPSVRVETTDRVGNLSARQVRVLKFVADAAGGASVRRIAAELGVAESPWVVREDLAALKKLGLVRSTGWGRGARWVPGGS